MHNQERQLTPQESKLLEKFKVIIANKEMRSSIYTADYLIGEMESIFGCDIAEFVIGYRFGLYQDDRSYLEESGSGNTDLSNVGHLASEGACSPFAAKVNSVMCEFYESTGIDHHGAEAKALSTSIASISSTPKDKAEAKRDK